MTIRKICILGLDDYAMLTGDSRYGFVGGESVQHVLLARAWRDLGVEVSIVVHDLGQPRLTCVDGIQAVAAFEPAAGIPIVRFVHPRVSSVLRALRSVDADVYYQSPAGGWSGIAVGAAKMWGKRSIVRIASDLDCVRGQQLIRHYRDRKLYEYGVLNASLLAAQTVQQQQLLRENYGVASERLNIAVETPAGESQVPKDIDVLWIGNLRPVKRADLLVELARRLPQYRFALVGARIAGHEVHYDAVAREAAQLPNVLVTGSVPYEQTGEWFNRSRLHVNTSDAEGFPNTFLQAWIRGVPVVSFFDPDQLIQRQALGRACQSIEEMAAAIDALLRRSSEREMISTRARSFVEREYSARYIAARYLELLGEPVAPAASAVDELPQAAVRDRLVEPTRARR